MIFKNALEAGRRLPGAVVAIGKFDALHLGHKRVIGAAVKKAEALKVPCVVLTFDPSPALFPSLFPYKPVLSMAERIEILLRWGVDAIILMPFDQDLACMSPEAFAKDILGLQLKPRFVVVGEDFCFGKEGAGRVPALKDMGRALGFSVSVVPLVSKGGEKVTAAGIRRLIDAREKAGAERLLGRRLSRPSRKGAARR